MIRFLLRAKFALACFCFVGVLATPSLAAQPDSPGDDYDAGAAPTSERVGWLRPNYTQPNVDAPFALVDNTGQIRAFVRPAENVRIGRYVNHRIRVRGMESSLRGQPVGLLEVVEAGEPDAVLGRNSAPQPPATGRDRRGPNSWRSQTASARTERPTVDPFANEPYVDGPNGEQPGAPPSGAPFNGNRPSGDQFSGARPWGNVAGSNGQGGNGPGGAGPVGNGPSGNAPGGNAPGGNNRFNVRQVAFEEIQSPTLEEIPPQTLPAPRSRLTTPAYAPPGASQEYNDAGLASPYGPPPGSVMDDDGEGDGHSHQHWNGDGPACGSCGGCGHSSCTTCCCNACGPPGRIWVRAEYLYWWTKGMETPPLVSTGPDAANPGYLGSPGTQVLFGGNRVNGFGRSGGRITLGAWLNCCQTVGIEGDFFGLASASTNYSATSFGSPILSRPFYDVGIRPGQTTVVGQNVELVAETGIINGTVAAYTSTGFYGAGIRGRFNLCCSQNCICDPCLPCCLNGPVGHRIDFLLGYRYLQLTDAVGVQENLTATNTTPQTGFVVRDNFNTRDQFNGVDLGFAALAYKGRWSFEFTPRMALGDSYQVANVAGSTAVTQNGNTTNYNGGLLAQQSNIGHYSQNQFAVVPELDFNLGYWLTPRLRAIVGYSFIYWSNVARAGNIIDTNVNSTSLPAAAANGVTPSGDPRYPMFAWNNTDFWAQGINAGLDYRW